MRLNINMTNSSLPVVSSEAGLSKYMDDIRKFPMLSEQEESDLANKWYFEQDINAAHILVTSHLRLVAKIAMQYKGYGLPMIDLISEGNIGLMTAVKKFDPTMGNRLATYAMWWIKAHIQDYILKSWSMVKMGTSANHKKLFFNLRKIKSKILQTNAGVAPHNEIALIAKELDVPESDVSEMNDRFTHYETSLNDSAYDDDAGEVIDLVAEPSDNQEIKLIESDEYNKRKEKFESAMLLLSERERDIIKVRRMSDTPKTLDELSSIYGVSSERIRQIEEKGNAKTFRGCCKLNGSTQNHKR
jgi:RNA polymerase sigma-32 factor